MGLQLVHPCQIQLLNLLSKLADVGVICVASFIIWKRLLFEIIFLKDDLNSLPG